MRSQRLEQLSALIGAIEDRSWSCDGSAIDHQANADHVGSSVSAMSGLLLRGVVHEWFGLADLPQNVEAMQLAKATLCSPLPRWTPPLGILLHLARCSFEHSTNRCVVWIGKNCWPYPHALVCGDDYQRQLLQHSLFIDCPNQASRLWAIDSAARCPAVAAIIADGSGLAMAHTRRLQLAAAASSALMLLTRPPCELDRLSAATLRWLVSCTPATDKAPKWIVQLLRCKSMQHRSKMFCRDTENQPRWMMEWNRAQGGVVIHAPLVDRPAPAAQPQRTSILRSA